MKDILIVGGTSGMGRAIAERLLADGGHSVTVTGRSQERLDRVMRDIGNPALRTRILELSDEVGIPSALADVTELDHLVLAGSGDAAWGAFATLEPAAVGRAFEVKALGYLRVIQAVLPQLAETASITVLGGAAGRKAMPGTAGVAMVNGALQSLVRTLAIELAPRRVNLVSPGLVDTPAYSGMPEEQRRAMFASAAQALPVRRIGRPADIADVVATVIAAPFMTGSIVDVDGGASL
jgi:NAD(P)-dependent dehydrogenase (short-subunit alcohol dehydrogenase family)